MKSKYNAKKITVDGIRFDSKDEARYYEYLKKLKAKGVIENFELQPKFTLIPAFIYKGEKERPATYTLDFLIYNIDGTEIYVDVKGDSTPQGELKFKMLKHLHPDMDFRWISRSLKYSESGWIDFKELKKKRREIKKNA
ncbi:DUF1064 domain-containing protein [Clostridium sp. AWRP]|uniref:DUF1064 domain-containing protein n=1 Tax=Clostridium sp. AWRP TaxID=2212991 RepID=UPI000FD7082B|nr:DUF1064 domain-containing protein [Clostridium sp. AWRP]AZV56054.1 DUF1064 domain-containing protein [Clostridium sp. AWRP]